MRRALISALFLTPALPALADCPVSRQDTADGIYVTFDNTHVRYDLLADGSVMEQETDFEGGAGFRVHSVQGAFVLQNWRTQDGLLEPGGSERIVWSGLAPEDLPVLTAGQVWRGDTVLTRDDGGVVLAEVAVVVAPEETLIIGACSYAAWPIEIHSDPGAGVPVFVDYLTYLPSLGIGIYQGGAETTVPFTPSLPQTISTEPPTRGEDGYFYPAESGPDAPPGAGNPMPAPPPQAPGGSKSA